MRIQLVSWTPFWSTLKLNLLAFIFGGSWVRLLNFFHYLWLNAHLGWCEKYTAYSISETHRKRRGRTLRLSNASVFHAVLTLNLRDWFTHSWQIKDAFKSFAYANQNRVRGLPHRQDLPRLVRPTILASVVQLPTIRLPPLHLSIFTFREKGVCHHLVNRGHYCSSCEHGFSYS